MDRTKKWGNACLYALIGTAALIAFVLGRGLLGTLICALFIYGKSLYEWGYNSDSADNAD